MDMETVRSAQLPKKTVAEEFDLVVLGSGTGSKIAAWTTAQQGKRVALIERKYIGGSCHNIACLPSKNIIHSAKIASYVRTAQGVWALGEVAGSPQFTHISFDDFRVFRDDLSSGKHVTTGRQVPFCLFTDPEFARVGLSETEAKRRGIPYRLFKIPMEEVLRARTLSETRGFLKALVEMDGDRILGFAGFAVDAGETMSSVQIAMIAGLPYTALREAILTHPTLVEGLNFLFAAVPSVMRLADQRQQPDPTKRKLA
jgi:pyruvate/2-oxoglutarate dehydrogenase complex dihydrolipoamide dehydrogenase (E3) component